MARSLLRGNAVTLARARTNPIFPMRTDFVLDSERDCQRTHDPAVGGTWRVPRYLKSLLRQDTSLNTFVVDDMLDLRKVVNRGVSRPGKMHSFFLALPENLADDTA